MKHNIRWGIALLLAAAACLSLLGVSVMAQEEAPVQYQEETPVLDATATDAVISTPAQQATGTDAVTKPAKGDINGDGSITLKDVTILFQYVNQQTSTLANLDGADVIADGSITLKDVTRLFQYVNKQITIL